MQMEGDVSSDNVAADMNNIYPKRRKENYELL